MDFKKLLSWFPGWLGFLALILVGIAMLINGIANPNLDATNKLGFIVFGLCAALIGAVSWIVGGTSEIEGRTGKVGVTVGIQDMPWWAWLIDAGILAVALILFFVLK